MNDSPTHIKTTVVKEWSYEKKEHSVEAPDGKTRHFLTEEKSEPSETKTAIIHKDDIKRVYEHSNWVTVVTFGGETEVVTEPLEYFQRKLCHKTSEN